MEHNIVPGPKQAASIDPRAGRGGSRAQQLPVNTDATLNEIYDGVPSPKLWGNTVYVDKTKEFFMLGGTNISDSHSKNI